MANNKPEASNASQPAANCCAEKCGKKASRLSFCDEHFGWFKEGLVNKKGVRPTDFDKKYQDFLSRSKKAA